MHIRKILRTLIVTSVLSFSFSASAAKVDVYKEFGLKIEALEKALGKEKDTAKRYDLFLKTYGEILQLRKQNPRQPEEKELHMSFFMDSLAPLPAKKDFQVKKCPQYKKEVKDTMKTYSPDQKEPWVEKALNITEQICK